MELLKKSVGLSEQLTKKKGRTTGKRERKKKPSINNFWSKILHLTCYLDK